MKITIIGAAGCIGSCAAFNIASHALADELVMIDGKEDALKQHILDLSTAMSEKDMIIRAGNLEDMKDSNIVIMTAGAPQGIVTSRMEFLTANLSLFKDIAGKITKLCPDSVVITVTNPVDPFNYAMYLLSSKHDRRKFIGYSANDSFRFRMMAADILNVRPHRVKGIVIGEHGETQALIFSSLRVDGKPITVTEEFRQKIKDQIPNILKTMEAHKAKTGRTAGWTCAMGLATICRAIKNNAREIIPCSSILDGEYGARDLSMSVPAIIGKDGVQNIKILKLAEDEQEAVTKSINHLATYMNYMKENLGTKK
jgi:malate dehydrogenase